MIKRLLQKPNWHNLRSIDPISREFGFDRGTPIDRVYIEDFLKKNSADIKGSVCEIAESTYSKKFASHVTDYNVLHYTNDNPKATIIGDLCDIKTLPPASIDCFILTQTFNFIEHVELAIQGVWHMLRKDGVALITVAGLCQISRYDMDRWGDYWRFTDLSLSKLLAKQFGTENVYVETYGNVLTATSLIQGLCAEELEQKELFYQDKDYQVMIAARVKKL